MDNATTHSIPFFVLYSGMKLMVAACNFLPLSLAYINQFGFQRFSSPDCIAGNAITRLPDFFFRPAVKKGFSPFRGGRFSYQV